MFVRLMAKILFMECHEGRQSLATVKLTKRKDLADSIQRSRNADLVWQMGYFLKKEQPLWSGFMQGNLSGSHPGKATFSFLPIINLNPSDESCIFSILLTCCKLETKTRVQRIVYAEKMDYIVWLLVETAGERVARMRPLNS